jgi:F0F1-type ATP synthase membrane subunit b/b'
MDVLVLIDKLDDLVHNAKAVPLTDQVRIDREEIYDILDQMRATIPEEIKQARWIVKERQEMLAEAKRECDRLIGEAREQAMREASQTEIVKLAERQSQDIVEEARRDARETRLEMEDWADGSSRRSRSTSTSSSAPSGGPRAAPRALTGDGRRRHRPDRPRRARAGRRELPVGREAPPRVRRIESAGSALGGSPSVRPSADRTWTSR